MNAEQLEIARQEEPKQQRYAQPLQNANKTNLKAISEEQLKENLTKKILSIPNKERGRNNPNARIQFKNIINGYEGYIEFFNILNENWKIILRNGLEKIFTSTGDLLKAGWVMNYTRSDLDGLKRFRKIAQEKVNLENPDRILLGYKIKNYIHLYLDDPTPGGSMTLGCWGPNPWGIVEYRPPKIEFNGMIYNQHNALSFNDAILDDLIAAVIRNRTGEKVVQRKEKRYTEEYDKNIANYNKTMPLDTYHNDDYDKAIANYTKAIQLNQNDALAYFNRGNAYFYKGDYDEAIADYNLALILEPNFEEAKQNLKLAQKEKMNQGNR